METAIKITEKFSIKDQKVLNNADTRIRMRFVSLDIENKEAVVQILYNGKPSVLKVHVSAYALNWMMNKTKYYIDGKFTGDYLSGYQKFLVHNGYPLATPLSAMEFECDNHSEDYGENPFRITFYPEYQRATITLVNISNCMKKEIHNPMDPNNPKVVWYYKRHKETGRVLTLPKKHYRRIEVK